MSRARQRHLALLVVITVALTTILVLPAIGGAQDATPNAAAPDAAALIEEGEALYNRTCIACHQEGGTGVSGNGLAGYPALAGNAIVNLEDPTVLVQTLISGRAGMPNFRSFSDEEIAAVASYVRQAWGNTAGPVDPALVTELRAAYTVPGLPEATPIATEFPGTSLAAGEITSETAATPSTDTAASATEAASAQNTPSTEGGATSGGITPVPTIGQ